MTISEGLKIIVFSISVLSLMFGVVYFASKSIQTIELQDVGNGRICATASRGFNISIDCWLENKNDNDSKQGKNKRMQNHFQGYQEKTK